MDVEICVETLEEAKLAAKHGAKRIELCAGLDAGGLTPSPGMIKACVSLPIEVHALIRPRAGDFCYDESTLGIINEDIQMAKQCGAKGVVVGVLDANNKIDIVSNKKLVDCAKSLELEVTFHRAFDLTSEPFVSLQELINLGFDRLLTSGQKPTAIEGIDLINKLANAANGQIQIMVGSGVNADNVVLLAQSGINAVHFSSRKPIKNIELNMGIQYIPDEEKITSILNQLST